MVRDMRGLFLPYGFLSNRASVGGSVARASEAKVSIIRLTHNICTAFRGESCGDKLESYLFARKTIVVRSFTAVSFLTSAGDRILKYMDFGLTYYDCSYIAYTRSESQVTVILAKISLESFQSRTFTIRQYF